MKKILEYAVIGFFLAITAAIIFVQAGKSGSSGGQQSADIINATGSALANTAKGLQGAG